MGEDDRQDACATMDAGAAGAAGKGGHAGPPLQVSIISFAVERAIRLYPEQAAAEMLKLIRENAALEAELLGLREKLMELAR
jgi:hypothetical protein